MRESINESSPACGKSSEAFIANILSIGLKLTEYKYDPNEDRRFRATSATYSVKDFENLYDMFKKMDRFVIESVILELINVVRNLENILEKSITIRKQKMKVRKWLTQVLGIFITIPQYGPEVFEDENSIRTIILGVECLNKVVKTVLMNKNNL